MVAWRRICVPKREGGLGVRQLRNRNEVAISKFLWRLHARIKDLWVHWARGRLRGHNLWEAKIPQDCAWTWRKMLQQRDKIKQFMGFKIRDGRQCSLFYDIWLGSEPLCDRIDITPWGKYEHIAEWINNGEWRIPVSFVRCYPEIAEEICATPILISPDIPI